MDEELSALHKIDTWDLVPPLLGKSVVGCRWVYKIKTNSDRSIERYKARLLDVKNAFLNEDLQEEVYMALPSGISHDSEYVYLFFEDSGNDTSPHVQSICTHNSASTEAILDPFWQQAMDEELSALHKIDTWDLVPPLPGKSVVGCRWVYKIKTNSDRSIERYKARLLDVKNAFLNEDLQEEVYMALPSGHIILSLYVDGMIIIGDNIDDILERARLLDNKTVDIPIEVNARYSSADGLPLIDLTLYRTIVGSLVYLTITRSDIAHVHVVNQFVISPTTIHY
ncbi:PREDICTED: uncharacterized protein LOC105118030 [Populus euphratica]|uniref:Uncharacterized protein LOC105118030 n=1 Tax=Populus euphratica TaxID=75702 RepID=A0AAJ6TPA3_POPEU|nr:PREDICTED: uncharacterized protein LOC105118030 [Populus euphratica]